MPESQTNLSRVDAEDCALWILSEVGTRIASKHQKGPLVATHMARQTVPKYLRGSDLSERLHASFKVLVRAGYTQKEALLIVVEKAKKYLGKSRRGRPRLAETKRDFIATMESVRGMMNAFARRTRDPESVVRWWVAQFLWGREIGVIRGSEFDPEFGRKIHEAQLESMRALRRLRGF
jgi:hypothetical protein